MRLGGEPTSIVLEGHVTARHEPLDDSTSVSEDVNCFLVKANSLDESVPAQVCHIQCTSHRIITSHHSNSIYSGPKNWQNLYAFN